MKDAQSLDKIASDSDLFAKKVCAKEIFGSHLLLGEKLVRASAPKILNSSGEFGGEPWGPRRASPLSSSKKPLSSVLVPSRGFEPLIPYGNGVLSAARMPVPPRGLHSILAILDC